MKKKSSRAARTLWSEEVTIATPWLLVTLLLVTGVFVVFNYIS